ncbi:MAG: Uma2 family endonuclease [Cyanobacteria bacterium CRU_2_1]|nr:Uma2 family endonuclease [Cyanobacteria bacterium RU_5_0]NJR58543.1 Uma2 family endonuclease [Cyanobacteria bacterium CRU_2_1]
MSELLNSIALPPPFPDHTQLPESDGTFVKKFQEHPQSLILTDSIGSILQRLHPDGHYCIGQDCGIYWRETDPPERGAEAPDWFYVPGVPPNLDGKIRRSYVLWREFIAPTIILEFASGDGSEERDRTPLSFSAKRSPTKPGKFWVYERIIRAAYYGIYEINNGILEVYDYINGHYEKMTPNARGHYPIAPMEVELGLLEGTYQNQQMLWLRWWDLRGNLLPTGQELAEKERQEKEQERQKRSRLVEKLRSLPADQLQALSINSEDLDL